MKSLILILFVFSFSKNSYSQRWTEYLDSAQAFSDQKKTGKAIEYYYKVKEALQKDSALTNSHARICNNFAYLYWEIGEYQKAEPLFLEAKNIREKLLGKEHPDYATSCDNLAVLYAQIGPYQKAESLFLEAKSIRKKTLGKEHPNYALSCNNLASLYYNMGQYPKAEPLHLEAKNIREKLLGKEHPDYAESCTALADLYFVAGQYEKAASLYIEAKNIREKVFGKEHRDYARSCNNLAVIYRHMGQYEKAEPLLLEAKEIRQMALGKEHPDYAESCNSLATLYSDLGQYKKAELLYLEAKSIREKRLGKEHPDYASTCSNLALLYSYMGQKEKVEPLYAEAKNIIEKALGKEHPDYASACNNLAVLYATMAQYEKAESLYLEDKQINEKVTGKENPAYASSCNNLAGLYSVMGQYEKAEPLYLEARKVIEKMFGKEHSAYASNCNGLAVLYGNMHKPEKANDFYVEAFKSKSIQLKKVFQFTSEPEKQSWLKQNSYYENNFFSFYATGYPPSKQGLSYDVSLFNRNLVLSSIQKLRQAIYATSDTSVKNKSNSWINLREQISFWSTKPIVERPANIKDLEEQANTLERRLTILSSAFKKEQSDREVTWKGVQQYMKENEATIEFIEFKYYNGKQWTGDTYYVALVLRKDKQEPELIRLFEERQLDSILSSIEYMPIENRVNTLYAGNQSLYNLVWKPLEKYLNGISKVYFAATGNLFKISFVALPVDSNHVLGDKYQLIQLNTTATVIDSDLSFINGTHKIQLYGGILYDADTSTLRPAESLYQPGLLASRSLPEGLIRGSGFKYLPGTRKETEEIRKQATDAIVPVDILSGTHATEESVKVLNGKASPSVLHIATHGFFFPDPKDDERDEFVKSLEKSGRAFKRSDDPLFRSGLVFAGANNAWRGKPVEGIEDGILTAYEVSNMYLPNTKLVVLSACETALGDIQGNEGVYGLQRAFKMAGVQNLVMSLWKVPDAETAEFMQLLYKNLFAKQTTSNAFYNAQKIMRNKYRSEPYKWAAWILVR